MTFLFIFLTCIKDWQQPQYHKYSMKQKMWYAIKGAIAIYLSHCSTPYMRVAHCWGLSGICMIWVVNNCNAGGKPLLTSTKQATGDTIYLDTVDCELFIKCTFTSFLLCDTLSIFLVSLHAVSQTNANTHITHANTENANRTNQFMLIELLVVKWTYHSCLTLLIIFNFSFT